MSGVLTRAGALRAFSKIAANLKVVNDVNKQQFSISLPDVEDAECTLHYLQKGNNITFTNTYVPFEFQGKGAGKLLASTAFKYAQDNNLNIKCQCQFLCNYYTKHKAKYDKLKITLEPSEE